MGSFARWRILIACALGGACGRTAPSSTSVEAVDYVARLVASPSVVASGARAAISVFVSPVRGDAEPGRTFTLTTTVGTLSVEGGPAAPTTALPWKDGGALGFALLQLDSDLASGTEIVLRVTTPARVVRTIGDISIPVRAPDPADAVVTIDGEDIELNGGWTVSVHRDFSASFSYRPDDFDDGGLIGNSPRGLALTHGVWGDGLVVSAGRSLIALPEGGPVELHDYTPTSNDSGGPDNLIGLTFFESWPATGAPALFAGSSSLNGGDGLYRVDPDWSMTRLLNVNNTRVVLADPSGAFEGGGATLYRVSGGGLRSFPDDRAIDGNVQWCGWAASDEIACSMPTYATPTQIHLISTNIDIPITARNDIKPVAPPAAVDGLLLALADHGELVDIRADGGEVVHARSATTGWSWWDAVAPPATHVLGAAGPAVYVLENSPTLDRQRILRFVPP